MYDKILVPVVFDGEHDNSGSLKVAHEISNEGAEVTLLHVMEEVPSYAKSYLPEDFRASSRADVSEGLQAYADQFENATIAVVEGSPGRCILDWLSDHENDCVIIASHRPGLQDYFLGSTAARVVRHASCAVHVLR